MNLDDLEKELERSAAEIEALSRKWYQQEAPSEGDRCYGKAQGVRLALSKLRQVRSRAVSR